MKTKIYILTFFMTLLAFPLAAQNGQDVESVRIAFLTRRLQLTPEEAKVFWPVYDAYQAENKEIKRSLRLEKRNARESFAEMSDKEVEEVVERMVDLKRRELDVFLKYHEQFKSVLPIKKVAKLYKAEQEFTKILLKRLQNQRAGAPGGRRGGGGRFR